MCAPLYPNPIAVAFPGFQEGPLQSTVQERLPAKAFAAHPSGKAMVALAVQDLPTFGNAAAIGLVAGDPKTEAFIVEESFSEIYRFEDFNDPSIVADFTGYVPRAFAVDANNVPVGADFDVTPDPGDTTGEFRVIIDNTLTTGALGIALRDNAVSWILRIDLGLVTAFLICAPFNLEDCA